MLYKNLIQNLGFSPKENTLDVFIKKYADGYAIEIDFVKEKLNYGNKITAKSKTTQNFSQTENWVVLECVNRLLEKGYQPQNITLEKTWKTGHGTSGRLDILVTRDNGSAYLMIECKTWGTEFDKEFKKLEKNGGQLFTYFQQDKNAEVIMLYASELDGKDIKFRNEIVKIEEDYRQTANVKDFFERWNRLPKSNGIFDSWATAYELQSKALTKKDLIVLKQEDSSFIFNRFLEILRHNVVSDKPNAFNKIFTLFLCKIIDEDRNDDEQLHFQWLEGEDDHISFQKRMTDLYNRGMLELLEKKVTDVSDEEFDKQFGQIDEEDRNKIKDIFTELRLKKNNEFAIKEVYDNASFKENAKVVKEVVELLQVYKIRYNYRQQFLSDFFELLLTTGLKQESGQFFTPVPIARFIIRSLPFQEIAEQKLKEGNKKDLLPKAIDYAAGSGHFITEAMEEIQKHIETLNPNNYSPSTKKELVGWKANQFDWAEKYVYGIEKDYRLVKTSKVSCYLHGDGLAKIIHGDGLGDFATSTEFKDLLKETDKTYPQDNKQFDIIISNPPYSVSAFKGLMNDEKAGKGFDLYNRLTDQSPEIECLFIERTKQLLKDGGVAGIILPSSILSNTGLYTETREIILKYFDILAISEMGSNTFMATGTNTVTLFLKRRNNADWVNIQASVTKIFTNSQDIAINGIEKPISKYVAKVWENITFDDYRTLLQKSPNKKVEEHETYQEYSKKTRAKNDEEKWSKILAIEQEKLLYFIIALPQKIVLVKTGDKKEEKRFLGYEFSNRRGSEGIHAIQRGKAIDECTQLYDANTFDNPKKASTYIYRAFSENRFDLEIPENLQKNISYQNLVDLFTFDRSDFEKNISLLVKKKVEIESKWNVIKLGEVVEILDKRRIPVSKRDRISGDYPYYGATGIIDYIDKYIFDEKLILIGEDGAKWGANENSAFYVEGKYWVNNHAHVLKPNRDIVLDRFVIEILNKFDLSSYVTGLNVPKLNQGNLKEVKIPLPPKDIQEKIVAEIEVLEKQEQKSLKEIKTKKEEIESKFINSISKGDTIYRLSDTDVFDVSIGKRVLRSEIKENGKVPVFSANVSEPFGYIDKSLIKDFSKPSVLWGIDGDWMVVYHPEDKPFYPTDHCGVLRVKNSKVNERFLAFILEKEGAKLEFSRNKRASIDRIKGIKIQVPSISEQKKIVSQIEKTETKITALEKNIALIPQQKEAILKKYL